MGTSEQRSDLKLNGNISPFPFTTKAKKGYYIREVENGFVIATGRMGDLSPDDYVAKDIEEVGSILKKLYHGKPVA